MSATLAHPYRDFAIDYSQHASCKPEEHEGTLVYQSQQPHFRHAKQTNAAFPSGNSHGTAFEQHHANATVLSTATPQPTVSDISQAVVLNPAMLPRQIPVQYAPANFDLAPTVQRGKKRTHSETDPEGGSADLGIRQLPVLPPDASSEPNHSPEMLFSVHGDSTQHHHSLSGHGFGPQDPMTLPQHHHHHHLPPHASLRAAERQGMNVETSPLASGPPSVVGQPGMPDPAPRPRGPKLKFTPEEDALLVELKENKNLTWKQIADFFPGRTSGTLQVRYCTKLKAKDVAWSDEMVQRLRRAMQEYDNDRWRIIAGKVGNGFTPAACREKATQL
ncbi:hypothetical protein BDV18DRAFT_157861 [Aspergillus unguis]